MMVYHGTDNWGASSIQGPPLGVDVARGGGELGQGFYLGDNMTLAISWAKGRYPNPSVLEFTVDNKQYAQLTFHQLNAPAVLNIYHQLQKLKTLRIHQFGFDVVFGPLATNQYAAQYKFESQSSQTLLNSSTIQKIL